MAINVEVDFSPDLSVNKEVIYVQIDEQSRWKSISAASLVIAGRDASDLRRLLVSLWDALSISHDSHEFWLCIGNYAWQPDNRIVRYRQLWGALRSKNIDLQGQYKSKEHCLESDSGVKYFGAIKLDRKVLDGTVEALIHERCAYVVALPIDADIDSILVHGWSGMLSMDRGFIDGAVMSDGYVCKKIGEFDDREQGFVLMGGAGVKSVIEHLSPI